jgi:hypothetical protein
MIFNDLLDGHLFNEQLRKEALLDVEVGFVAEHLFHPLVETN